MTIASYLTDISNYLQANGFGTPGTDIFVASISEVYGNMIILTPYPAADPDNIASFEKSVSQIHMQVLVRDLSNNVALAKASALYQLFRLVANQDIGDTHFLEIRPYCPPSFLLKTNDLFYEYYINCTILMR